MHAKRCFGRTAMFAAFVLVLSGCGGGGSSSAPTVATTPMPPVVVVVPKPTEPAAITSVPAFSYTDPRKADALTRLNAVRASVGLGLVAQSVQVDRAAQAHSDYQVTNLIRGHGETSTLPGFTGVDAGARLTAAGYAFGGWGEVIAYDTTRGAQAVDLLVSLPYHRVVMLQYGYTVAGVGIATATSTPFTPYTVNLAYPPGGPQGAPGTPVVVLPTDGATSVPRVMLGGEFPDPIPENAGVRAGYPVSLQVNEAKVLAVTSFTLAQADGTAVTTKLLSAATDAELQAQNIQGFACALPRASLAANTTYRATFVGTVDGAPLTKTWTFTTGP